MKRSGGPRATTARQAVAKRAVPVVPEVAFLASRK